MNQIVQFIHEKAFGPATASLIFKGLIGAHLAEASAMTYYVNSRGASLATTVSLASTILFLLLC